MRMCSHARLCVSRSACSVTVTDVLQSPRPALILAITRDLVRIVRSRCGGLIGLAACVAACVVASAAGATSVPGWVKPTTERTAKRWFGRTPVRLDAIDLGNRVAIVATFSDVVRCRPCGSPDSRGVRGRIFRFSFDRTTRSPWSATALSIRRCASRSACYAGAPHITLSDGSDWKAVIGDVYADGRSIRRGRVPCSVQRSPTFRATSTTRVIDLDEAAAAMPRRARRARRGRFAEDGHLAPGHAQPATRMLALLLAADPRLSAHRSTDLL